MVFRAVVGLVSMLLGAVGAGPAAAEWLRAESPRFIVYSEGRESALRDYVQKLETFDRILRYRLNIPVDEVPHRKLPIYLVGGPRQLAEIFPGRDRNIRGVYSPTTEDIFAVAVRGNDDDFLLHEYAHHFMYQNTSGNFPGWLVEGFAEYLMTAEVRDDRVQIGQFNENRAEWLIYSSWIPLEELLSKRPLEVRRGPHLNTYYPVAWLLTHWFMSDDERQRMLETYTEAVASGADPVTAMEAATGLTLVQLRNTLREYMTRRLQGINYTADFPRVDISVTRLPPSADDLLLLGQRLKVGVAPEMRAATAEEVRRRAARHPDDPFAQLQLGHAELHFGDAATGEAVLTRLLEREPDNVEALQLMATRYMQLAEEGDPRGERLRQARTYLARAYAADDGNYYTFILLGRTREGAAGYPNENDLTTWALALTIAPQLATARLGYASALMRTGKFDDAIVLLRPLANSPHGGAASDAAQVLLDRAEAGQPPLSAAQLEAAAEAEEAEPAEPPSEPAAPPPA